MIAQIHYRVNIFLLNVVFVFSKPDIVLRRGKNIKKFAKMY